MNTFKEIENYASANKVPIIRAQSAVFLQETAEKTKAKNILEIGTAIGYSGSLLLSACPEAKLTTIEIDKIAFEKAAENFEKLGLTNRVKQILGDAKEELKKLADNDATFDFVFLDGPKGQYIKYLPYCKKLLRQGGILFADNVYLHGMVLSQEKIKHKHRTMVNNLRKFLSAIESDKDFETTIYNIEDGIAISKKLF